MSYLDEVKRKKEIAAQKAQRDAELKQTIDTTKSSGDSVAKEVMRQAAKSRTTTQNVQVENPDLAKSNDVGAVTDAINKLNFTTFVAQSGSFSSIVESLASLCERMQSVMDGMEKDNPDKIVSAFASASSALQAAVNSVKNIKIKTDDDVVNGLQKLNETISSLQVSPVVNVPAPKVTVNEKEIDLSPLAGLLEGVERAIKDNKIELPDNSDLRGDIQAISKAIKNLSFPVPNYILPFKDTDGKAVQLQLDATGRIPTAGPGGGTTIGDVQVTDGTNKVNVLKSDGTAVGQNAAMVSGSAFSSGTLTLNLASPATVWYDLANYAWVSLEILSNSSAATLTFQTSGDAAQTNIRSMILFDSQTTGTSGATSTTSAIGTSHGPRVGRYFRISSNVSGVNTVNLVLTFYTIPSALPSISGAMVQSGTWNVGANSATGSAVPANAFYAAGNGSTGNLTGFRLSDFGDGQTAGILAAGGWLYNGTGMDRARANEGVSLLASAARTTTQTSADILNYNGLANLDVILDVTSAGTGSITLAINGKDPASGKYYLLLSGAAVVTNTTNRYSVGPYIAAVANVRAQDIVPRTFQIVVTANNANSITYSVGYNLTRNT